MFQSGGARLFRRSALERLSSPERLDQLMQVTSLPGWLALGGFFLIIVAALAWGVFGRIPVSVDGQGVLASVGGESSAVAFVPIADGALLRPGQVAQVSPVTTRPQEFGYLVGRIRSVSDSLVSEQELRQVLDETRVRQLLADGPVVRVEIDLTPNPSNRSG